MSAPITAQYKARTSTGARVEIKAADVSPEVNRLIVALLTKPETCAHVLLYAAGELPQGGFVSPPLVDAGAAS